MFAITAEKTFSGVREIGAASGKEGKPLGSANRLTTLPTYFDASICARSA